MLCFIFLCIFFDYKSIISSNEFRKRHRSIVMNNSSLYQKKNSIRHFKNVTRKYGRLKKPISHIVPFSADQRKNYFTYKTIQVGQFFFFVFHSLDSCQVWELLRCFAIKHSKRKERDK